MVSKVPEESNVISVNFTQSGKVLMARNLGVHAAWLGGTNPFTQGGSLWKAFNEGREMVARFAPLPPEGMKSWNAVDFSRNL